MATPIIVSLGKRIAQFPAMENQELDSVEFIISIDKATPPFVLSTNSPKNLAKHFYKDFIRKNNSSSITTITGENEAEIISELLKHFGQEPVFESSETSTAIYFTDFGHSTYLRHDKKQSDLVGLFPNGTHVSLLSTSSLSEEEKMIFFEALIECLDSHK